MVNWLDWVDSVVPVQGLVGVVQVLAVTRTGVLTVPALTLVTTSPLASEVAVPPGVSVIPPTVVLSPKLTVLPLSGMPPVSSTLKVTWAVSMPPVPFKEMLAGAEVTYWIEPAVGAVMVKVAEEDAIPLTEAVIVSVPAQPLSRYEPVALPFTVTTLALNTALPLLAQGDENVTVCGVVTDIPPLLTVTATLVVPNAESGFTPKTGLVMVTTAPPTE